MYTDLTKEEKFYANKNFKFSYSSLNKLLFSPSLFYKDYILEDREIRTDKHLVEGKLIHCLLFEQDKLNDKFNILPGKLPADSNIKVLTVLYNTTVNRALSLLSQDPTFQQEILKVLIDQNLYQTLKLDDARLEKIQTADNESYWEYLKNSSKDAIDGDTLAKCKDQAENIKSNKDVMALFEDVQTDFELDPIETHAEKYLTSDLLGKPFGLHGYLDYYKINHSTKTVTICDLKTTSKTISDFKETIDFYNYWLQAAIYCKLVFANLAETEQEYNILFKFVVVDKYNQVYVFDVTDETLNGWAVALEDVIERASYHYAEKNYSLPYDFLLGNIKL
jgi:hypothetical protein